MPRTSLLSHVVYFTAAQKRVFLAASKYSLTNLNAYIRDLLTRDVELRAEQGEPYFEGLRDELRASELIKSQGQVSQPAEKTFCTCGTGFDPECPSPDHHTSLVSQKEI